MVFRGGSLYGAATTGGAGYGTVFELSPTDTGGWNFRTLYEFQGAPDGSFPYGALLFDQSGHIYGTTYYGGADGLGSIYELTRTQAATGASKSSTGFKQGGRQ